jgi:hypothetical protein
MIEGARIWLSGSIADDASDNERQRIGRFVGALAREIFRRDGRLVPGGHLSLRETLLEAAGSYRSGAHRRAGLVSVVSQYYVDRPGSGVDFERFDACAAEPTRRVS